MEDDVTRLCGQRYSAVLERVHMRSDHQQAVATLPDIAYVLARALAGVNLYQMTRQNCMIASTQILVTGGAGFIGSHLVESLLREGFGIRVVDNLATGRRSNLAQIEGSYEWIEGDVADFDVCRRAV